MGAPTVRTTGRFVISCLTAAEAGFGRDGAVPGGGGVAGVSRLRERGVPTLAGQATSGRCKDRVRPGAGSSLALS